MHDNDPYRTFELHVMTIKKRGCDKPLFRFFHPGIPSLHVFHFPGEGILHSTIGVVDYLVIDLKD